MQLETDASGVPVLQDGKPVVIYDDGRKAPLDFVHLIGQVKRVSDERDTYRNEAEKAKDAARIFDGVTAEQIAAARKIDTKQLIEAGKMDEAVATRLAEAKAAWDKREAELASKLQESEGRIYGLQVSQRFKSTKALEDTFLDPETAEKNWAKHFKVEGDRVVGYYADGRIIYSASKPGEPADFDEALSILKGLHPYRDKWTKSANATGSGAPGSNGTGAGGRTMRRAEFFALPAKEQMKMATSGVAIVD